MPQPLVARRIGTDDYDIYAPPDAATAVGRIYRLPSVMAERWWWGIYVEQRRGAGPHSGIDDSFAAAQAAFRRAFSH